MAGMPSATSLRFWPALLLLGFSSGLPYQAINDTAKLWLRDGGVDYATLGLFQLVALPYSLKMLWAPLVDGWVWWPGRRRGWLWATQVLLVVGLLGVAALALAVPQTLPADSVLVVAFLLASLAAASATQDLAADAWRGESLPERYQGMGAGLWVMAYRLALLSAGWAGLVLAGQWGWPVAWAGLAMLMLPSLLGTMLAREPRMAVPVGERARPLVILRDYLRGLHGNYGNRLAAILAFALLFRLGDAALGAFSGVVLQDLGYSKEIIGACRSGVGVPAIIVGGLLGGLLALRLPLLWGLGVFGLLQAASNLAYAWLVQQAAPGVAPPVASLAIVIIVEQICGGLGSAVFVAWQIQICRGIAMATGLALLTGLMAAGRDVLTAGMGTLVESLGLAGFCVFTAVLGLPALVLLPWVRPVEDRDGVGV
jgi:PAT family beta-lactamase induction signal transducer AmpG